MTKRDDLSHNKNTIRFNNFLYMYVLLCTVNYNLYFTFFISSGSFWRVYLAPWEIPCVFLIIIKGFNKDNSAQVSPWDRRWREGTKGNQKSGAGGLLAEVMQDIQTLSAMAETEMAFKDYWSLA